MYHPRAMALAQRPLADGDLDQMWEIEREAFNADPVNLEWWKKCERAIGLERLEGLFLDGRLVATSGVLGYGQWFGGRSVPMGGVRAVAVRTEHRGRGYATRVVRASLEAMHRRGEVISALYPQVTRPYRRLGWEVAGTIVFRQVNPRVLGAIAASELPVRRASENDRATIRACYERVARTTNGFVDRRAGRWEWLFERFADDYFFVAGDEGYVLYRIVDKAPAGPEGFRLLVLDLVAPTAAGWRALWGMLGRTTSVVPTIFFRGGPSDPLVHVLDAGDVTVSRERPWMLRLVDASAAIAARGYPSDVRATVSLEIDDATCPWNAGRWTLVVDDGAARLERGGAGSVRLGVGALSALYSGQATTATLAQTSLIDGGREHERGALDRIFGGPAPWMLDEF
jgi:predicted acetyltransferase